MVAGEAAALGVVAGDASLEGAVVALVAETAAAVVAALDGAEVVAVVGDDGAVEVVPATMGTDEVAGVAAAAPAGSGDALGEDSVVCARSEEPATRRATTMTRLRNEFTNSSWKRVVPDSLHPS